MSEENSVDRSEHVGYDAGGKIHTYEVYVGKRRVPVRAKQVICHYCNREAIGNCEYGRIHQTDGKIRSGCERPVCAVHGMGGLCLGHQNLDKKEERG